MWLGSLLLAGCLSCTHTETLVPNLDLVRPYSYELEKQENPDRPIINIFERDGKRLVFLASHHENKVQSETFQLVKQAFKTNDVKFLMIEGYKNSRGINPKSFLDYTKNNSKDGFYKGSESSFAAEVAIPALVDNFSRFVLAWRVTSRMRARDTSKLLSRALDAHKPVEKIELISDGGPENANHMVASLIKKQGDPQIIHRLAMHQINKSNSMAENLFHKLKTDYLNYVPLNCRADINLHASFYIQQKNEIIPQRALFGLTPREMHTGTSVHEVVNQMSEQASQKRRERFQMNKTYICGACS